MKIYIAGPYTRPDPCMNTHIAIHAANRVLEAGHVPFIPHLTHLWHLVTPMPYEVWLAWDMHWLEVCDAVWRLPGDSPGADKEVARATELGIPVAHSFEQLAAFSPR